MCPEQRDDWCGLRALQYRLDGRSSYLGHQPGEGESRPYCVPARREDLTGLAPAWIGVGDLDLSTMRTSRMRPGFRMPTFQCRCVEQTGMYHQATCGHRSPTQSEVPSASPGTTRSDCAASAYPTDPHASDRRKRHPWLSDPQHKKQPPGDEP